MSIKIYSASQLCQLYTMHKLPWKSETRIVYGAWFIVFTLFRKLFFRILCWFIVFTLFGKLFFRILCFIKDLSSEWFFDVKGIFRVVSEVLHWLYTMIQNWNKLWIVCVWFVIIRSLSIFNYLLFCGGSCIVYSWY